MLDTVPPRKRGRPKGNPQGSFTFRLHADVREQLEVEAAKSGTTLSKEIQTRLAKSLKDPELIERIADAVAKRIA